MALVYGLPRVEKLAPQQAGLVAVHVVAVHLLATPLGVVQAGAVLGGLFLFLQAQAVAVLAVFVVGAVAAGAETILGSFDALAEDGVV